MNSESEIKFAGSRMGKLVRVNRFYSSIFGLFVSAVFWLTGVAAVLVWFFYSYSSQKYLIFTGGDQLLFGIFLSFLAIRSFLNYFVKNPEIFSPKKMKEMIANGEKVNLFQSFSLPLASALMNISDDLNETNSGEVLAALVKSNDSNFIFARLGIYKKDFLSGLENSKSLSQIRMFNIAEKAIEVAITEKHSSVEIGDMLVALADADNFFSAVLAELDLTPEDLANIVYWQTAIDKEIEKNKKILDPENLHLTGGIGKDWVFGYTPNLLYFASDMTEAIERSGLGIHIVGHTKETKLIDEALNRSVGANAILVGEPGVGKKTTVLGFADKVSRGKVLPNVAHKHIFELNVDLLISGLSGPGEFTERINAVLSEAAGAGNIIIFIDGIEKILSSGEAGQIDATEVLIPFLNYPEINFIGTTDLSSYNNLIASNAAIAQSFEKIEVSEPTDFDMIRILEDVAPQIEYQYKVLVTYGGIKEIIKLAKKYILDMPNPEKSISILDGIGNSLARSENKVISPDVVRDFVSKKTSIPVSEATGREKEILVNMETEMHKRVVNQVKAIEAVSGALRRSRAGVTDDKKPIGSFLFIGPTGVGKTETAKSLAEVYFGHEDAMIRFDMSEYQNTEDIYRLIGTPPGYPEKQEGELTSRVRNKPFTLLLFDELEKANPDILNLFLQILDEGFITSSTGHKAYFKNTIIIATSNAGANIIRQLAEKNVPYEVAEKQVLDYIQSKNIFRPEFLNRFTKVVYFSPLTLDQIKQVASMMIRSLAENILASKGITLKVEKEALAKLAQLGYDPEMGARPMARVIQEQIENFLAEKILRGEAGKGSEVLFKATDIKNS